MWYALAYVPYMLIGVNFSWVDHEGGEDELLGNFHDIHRKGRLIHAPSCLHEVVHGSGLMIGVAHLHVLMNGVVNHCGRLGHVGLMLFDM